MVSSPAEKIIDAIALLHEAAEELGISSPVIIGFKTMNGVHAIEKAMISDGKANRMSQIIGGIEINDIAFKARPL